MSEKLDLTPENFKIYKKPDEEPYFNKKDHAERSKANQPNHNKFWKKLNKKETYVSK